MAVTYVIKFHVAYGRRDEFLKRLEGVLDAMRSEPMFHGAILHRDPSSDDRFMLYETRESHEDVLNVQLQRGYRQAWHDALPRILAEERDITIWKPLRADRKRLPQSGAGRLDCFASLAMTGEYVVESSPQPNVKA
jgi:quinol monooxygenase YgiN